MNSKRMMISYETKQNKFDHLGHESKLLKHEFQKQKLRHLLKIIKNIMKIIIGI